MTITGNHQRLIIAATVAVCCAVSVFGQEVEPAPAVPTLPETRVIGEPPPMTAPEAVFSPDTGSDPLALPPPAFTQSTIFGTPSVRGYQAPASTTGSLIRIPDVDLPGSVSVVTQDLIRDQQAVRVDDLLRDVSGAAKLNDQLRPDSFILRGFEVRSRDYRKNGFMDPTYTPRDLANVERIEVLKGPASILYGTAQPSGAVNVITKKPLDTAYGRATFQAGSFDMQRYTVDSTGPIDDERHWLYRLNFAYENRDSFRDFYYNERVFVSPAITWQIDEDTAITWEGEYLKDRRQFDTGIAALNGRIGQIPIDTFLGEPGNDFMVFQDWRQSLFFDRRLNDIWTMRIGATSLFYYAPSSGTFPTGQLLFTPILTRSRQDIDQFFEQYHGITANVAGDFETKELRHRLVFGTEQGWFISNSFLSRSTIPGLQPLPINSLNPTYNNAVVLFQPAVFDSVYRLNRHGVYVQDLIDLNEHWKLMAGLRYDHADSTFYRELTTFGIPTLGPTNTTDSYDRWTPRVGLIYQPIPEVLSYYGSYTQSFDAPPGGPRASEDPLQPELGEAVEFGVKYQWTPKITAQAAWFWIRKENYTIDTTQALPPFFVTSQVGSLTSQGIELTLNGQITERWSTVSNYTLTDAVLRDDSNPDLDDRRPRNVPRNTLNLWHRYNVIQNSKHILGGGLGMLFVDDRLASFGGDLRLPDFTRWDAGVFYTRQRWELALYLENLFDRRYYSGSVNDLQIAPGAPFTVRAMAGVTY